MAKKKTKRKTVPNTRIIELQESRNGGQIALRGYSYQFLYSCYLVLSTIKENTYFNLEGLEDIDYIICENEKDCTMHIQLKYSELKQDASFMYAVLKNFLEVYLIDSNREFKLVYDFEVAKGHLRKLFDGTVDEKSQKYWENIIEKIKKENANWKWNGFVFEDFMSKISYERIEKITLENKVENMLIEKFHITTDNIRIFANSIKILCLRKMESRGVVELSDINKSIEEVKFDISKGVQNPAHSWITRIDFSTSSKFESDYFEGKKATPKDIANKLPVSRTILEKELIDSVNKNMVTIIKASSGQGKTTLALKTQYLLQEEYMPYQIICCNDKKEIGHIVNYFQSRIRLGEKPLILLDNLDAHLCEWNQLVQVMQSDVKYNYKILLTSRESDWYNFGGDISNIHSIHFVNPILSKEEAVSIYSVLQKAGYLNINITDWKSSWEKIADRKLLIEYVYLLTHGEMISERISTQMNEIGKSDMAGIKFEILRDVCFADVCGTRLPTRALLKELMGKSSYDVGEILKSMADEFLVHVSTNGDYIEGLHPVRSQHIVNRLHEYYPLEETAYNVTRLADIDDISVLFSHFPEFEFDKEKFYTNIVDDRWNLKKLKCYVSALRGTFSGSVLQYFKQNIKFFNDANEHGGLYILATDICPFIEFEEMGESLNVLEKMKESMPNNGNIQYLSELEESMPRLNIIGTDIYILSTKIYNKLKNIKTDDVLDIDSYAQILNWLYNMDDSMNLAQNINLSDLLTHAEKYSIETFSLLMYTSYCGNRVVYEAFVQDNIQNILTVLKHKTFSHRITIDQSENSIYVEYILRASDIKKGNQESVLRLKNICRTLPIYDSYNSDAIMPTLNVLQCYSIPNDTHKEMLRRNIVIMFHQEFTSLWLKTIQSNYEFDSVTEWVEYWFNVRQCICDCIEKICICIYKLLIGKNIGNSGADFDKKRDQLVGLLYRNVSYPKEHRPFEKSLEITKKFSEIRQHYFKSTLNFIQQVVGLIKKEQNDSRLALYNLKLAMAQAPQMHKFFEEMILEKEFYENNLRISECENQKLMEAYMGCKYYLQHNPNKYFNKYQIRSWYASVVQKSIKEVNLMFENIKQEYGVIFPVRVYEEGVLTSYPLILRSFDITNEEMIQNLMVSAISFVNCSFDYLIIMVGSDDGYVLPKAFKFPKRIFEKIHEIITSECKSDEHLNMAPYPMDVTYKILNSFEEDIEIQPQNVNPYIQNIGSICEELWVYSKTRELLQSEVDKTYCSAELQKVRRKINIMQNEINEYLNSNIADKMSKLCDDVYNGKNFDNEQLNAFVQEMQDLNI